MNLSPTEQKTLLALVAQHVESRRPVKTMIIQAARNAKSASGRNGVVKDLSWLALNGLITQHDDAWAPTGNGIKAAAAIKNGTAPAAEPEPETEDEPKAEAPPARPPSRDTLRQRQHTAPKPVTQPVAEPPPATAADDLKTCRDCKVTFRRPNASPVPPDRCERCHEVITAMPKQPRYQDHQGDDWIDEFARTATVDEFRGAMAFTLGKYLRRMGRKDRRETELRKIEDYSRRWREYEQALEVLD